MDTDTDESSAVVPTQAQALASWEQRLQDNGNIYSKTTKVHAMAALADGCLETVLDGVVETVNAYEVGDYIVQNPAGERYVMGALDFSLRYESSRPEPSPDPALASKGFKVYLPTGKILAHQLSEEEMKQHFPNGKFMASWGSVMIVEVDDYLAIPFPSGGEIYRIKHSAFLETYALRDLADYVPSQAEALAYWEGTLREDDEVYCKTTLMHAMVARQSGRLETVVDGVLETTKAYAEGDYIMHGTQGERYVMRALDFTSRYERSRPEPAQTEELAKEGFQLFRPTGKVWARELSDEDCAIHSPAGKLVASWGSTMVVSPGDYLAMPHPAGGELYRIERTAFENTYSLQGREESIPSQVKKGIGIAVFACTI